MTMDSPLGQADGNEGPGTRPVGVPPPLPPDRPPVFRLDITGWILDHNPLYLLSAALMLLGCYLLASALDLRAGEVGKLLAVLGTLNAYEFLVIGLSLFLWRRGIVRDGMVLLVIEALFLADLTFLNSEAAAADLWLGVGVNGGLLVLTLAKLWLVSWMLPMERTARAVGFVAVQMAMLCALPVILRALSVDGLVGALPFYLLWWIVGLMPAVYEAAARWDAARAARRGSSLAAAGDKNVVRLAWTFVPWVSLVAHLGFQHWVYRGPFFAVELVPVLLGGMIIARRMWGPVAVPVRLTLALVALALGLTNPDALGLPMPGTAVAFSPLMVTVNALALVIAAMGGWHTAAWMIGMLLILDALRLYVSWDTVGGKVQNTSGRTYRWAVTSLVPTTAAGWGVVAVIGAFVALAAGALVSLRRGQEEPPTL